MKRSQAIVWLVAASLVAQITGCGKGENTPAPTGETHPGPGAETPAPTVATKAQSSAPATAKVFTQELAQAANQTRARPELTLAPAKAEAPQFGGNAGSGSASRSLDQARAALASLSQDQVVRGLQEALGKGLQQAIARLGHEGGFLTNLQVRIPMPEKLQKVEGALRAIKQDKLADDFVATMNHAAEQAVPEAAGVFTDALKQMTIEDAKSILTGPNDAATQYFKKTTQTNLYSRFYPIVQKATEKTGVTATYKNLLEKANLGGLSQRLGGLGGVLGGTVLDPASLDLDGYVTTKAMDGLFKIVAEEEKQIRQNPVARTTELLQKVFGAFKR